jgi:hypothetical protein
MTNVLTTASLYGAPVKRKAEPVLVKHADGTEEYKFSEASKRSNEGAAEDLATNSAAAEALQPGVAKANPVLSTPKPADSSWDSCSDLSKPAWPGRKA